MYLDLYKEIQQYYALPLHAAKAIQNAYIKAKPKTPRDNLINLNRYQTKRNSIIVEFQIKYSRATVSYKLEQVIHDIEFIEACHPADLIKIGQLSKKLELLRIANHSNEKKRGSLFQRLKKRLLPLHQQTNSKPLSHKENFPLSVLTLFFEEEILYIKFNVINSNTIFNVPLQDFIKDKSLLFFTIPSDLIKIGYLASELSNDDLRLS